MDLFLAQPFGGRSLFQRYVIHAPWLGVLFSYQLIPPNDRIIISNMNEESKVFEKDIKILQDKIQDKVICQKVYNAVRTPLPENSNFRGIHLTPIDSN